VLSFILGLWVRVPEGWGMSETAGTITMNPAGAVRIGTVDLPIAGTEVKLADDGELLVRGPGVMRGYRDEPERTDEVLTADGRLRTGDVGAFADGYVRIVGPKKEIIINSAGKNMSSANIESAMVTACPLVGSAVAIGDQRPFVSALVVLERDAATAYAAANGLPADTAVLAEDEGGLAAVAAGVEEANATLSRVEHIRSWTVLPVFWEPGSDELTPPSVLKRGPIADKYAAQIEALYVE
jgi:long-subunit acyl-CoA synthetase (AMP-forming)